MMPKQLTALLVGLSLAAALISHSSSAKADLFQTAQVHYAQQDWAAALDQFLQVAQQLGDGAKQATAQFYAAESALQLKDYAQARILYQRLLDSESASDHHLRASFRLAESLHLAEDLQGALAAFQRFVEAYPRDDLASEARNHLGEILLESQRYDSALHEFAYVMEHCQGLQSDRARLGMARGLLALKRYDEVPITLGRLCQDKDTDIAVEALLILGRAKYEAGQFDQALAIFRRVYHLEGPGEAVGRARVAAGWALWKLSRLEEVAAEIEPLATENRFAADTHYLLGMTAFAANDWTEAGEQLQHAADEGAENRTAALFYSGESALLGGNPQSAKAKYLKLLEAEPNCEWADDAMWGLVKAARAAKSQVEFDQACEQLRAKFPNSDYVTQIPLVATVPVNQLRQRDSGTEIFEEAVGLERDGRFGGAITAYQEFLAQSGSGAFRAEALWRAARLQERLKQHSECRQLYMQLLAEFPEFDRTPAAMANLAWIEAASGNDDAAAKYCRELLEKFPQSSQAVEASYWLAVAAADEKKDDDAQWQVDWLLDRLNTANCSLNDSEKLILGQTLCLQCQLFASAGKWQQIAALLDNQKYQGVDGVTKTRLVFWRAEAALRLGNHTEARERFDELVTQAVGITESWVPMVTLRRAQLAARREDWQDVLMLADELDQQYPEFELAYECDYLRGRALAGRGEMSSARAAYGHVLENDWAAGTEIAAMAQWMIGESYFHQRNYEHARIAYEKVVDRHYFPEWQARAALQAGKCAELDDNWDAAANYYADAAERWRDTKSAHELNSRLRWVQEQVAHRQAALRR